MLHLGERALASCVLGHITLGTSQHLVRRLCPGWSQRLAHQTVAPRQLLVDIRHPHLLALAVLALDRTTNDDRVGVFLVPLLTRDVGPLDQRPQRQHVVAALLRQDVEFAISPLDDKALAGGTALQRVSPTHRLHRCHLARDAGDPVRSPAHFAHRQPVPARDVDQNLMSKPTVRPSLTLAVVEIVSGFCPRNQILCQLELP